MKTMAKFAAAAIIASFATEAVAEEWNVSVWGKRRAFTEHVEKLAELVSTKTNGEFTMNVSYGGLSKNREKLRLAFLLVLLKWRNSVLGIIATRIAQSPFLNCRS
jgi:hypothetical protein